MNSFTRQAGREAAEEESSRVIIILLTRLVAHDRFFLKNYIFIYSFFVVNTLHPPSEYHTLPQNAIHFSGIFRNFSVGLLRGPPHKKLPKEHQPHP